MNIIYHPILGAQYQRLAKEDYYPQYKKQRKLRKKQ